MHCKLGRKPPKLLLPLWILPPCRTRTKAWPLATCWEKLVKIACGLDICLQTDTQTYSLQLFATSPAGEVTKLHCMPHQNVSSYVGEWRGNQLACWLGSADVMKTCDYITVISVVFVLCECSVQCHSGISSRGFTCSCSKVGRGQVNLHCILMYCWASYLLFTLHSCMVYGCCICFLEVGGW